MKRFFGSSKPTQPGPSLNEVTERVDSKVNGLDEKIKKLDSELFTIREKMKKVKGPAQNGMRQRALQLLKQKKMYEQQRDQLMSQSFNMEQVNFASQTMKDTVTTVSAMKDANGALKKQFKSISLDEIEDLQDDLSDLLEVNNEIQETLGRSYGLPSDVDESELEDELAALGEELDFESTPSYLNSTSVPTTEPAETEKNMPVSVPLTH